MKQIMNTDVQPQQVQPTEPAKVDQKDEFVFHFKEWETLPEDKDTLKSIEEFITSIMNSNTSQDAFIVMLVRMLHHYRVVVTNRMDEYIDMLNDPDENEEAKGVATDCLTWNKEEKNAIDELLQYIGDVSAKVNRTRWSLRWFLGTMSDNW